MYRWKSITALLLSCCLVLAGCGRKEPEPESSQPEEISSETENSAEEDKIANEIILTADFSLENYYGPGRETIRKTVSCTEDVTPELLAEKLTEWIGLNFAISAEKTEKGLIVDWKPDSSIFVLPVEQKLEFTFQDDVAMKWFMFDSLSRTLCEYVDGDDIYFTMDGGKELTLENFYPVQYFSADEPYQGSIHYYDAFEQSMHSQESEYMQKTAGVWSVGGADGTAWIEMDGMGSYTACYADGGIESQGSVTYDVQHERFELHDSDGNFFLGITFDSPESFCLTINPEIKYLRRVSADQNGTETADIYAGTKGVWRIDGEEGTAYIEMDGKGDFTAYYASGSEEMSGYLEYYEENGTGFYAMYSNEGDLYEVFSFDAENEFHTGNGGGFTYIRTDF